jgi:hypothetical protein
VPVSGIMVRLVRPHQRRATARRNARGECGAAERSNTALGISTRERGPTAPSPVALGDPDRVRSFLGVSGFTDVELEGVQQPMYFGPDPDDVFGYFSTQYAGMVRDLDPETRARAHERLRSSLADHCTDQGVLYDSAAWLVHARRS